MQIYKYLKQQARNLGGNQAIASSEISKKHV